ncbi:MAG: glutathione-disulfide reductase, partial [Pseudomonadota bacterium]|nr:glutathione-disulfide reductase [Pseudomonadota bacterium]
LFDQRPSLRPAFDTVATVIFTHPQFANVGMTEETAKAKGYEFAVFDSEFRHLKYSLTQLQYRTRFKLLVDLKTDRILGIHAVGEEVGEILQGFSTLLHMGITKAQLDQTIGIHPTLAEELVTLREPSRVVLAE